MVQPGSDEGKPTESPLVIVAEKVSVAGLRESLDEGVIWIRNIFRLTLVVLSCYALYFAYAVIINWKNSGYRDEIDDKVNQQSLPFSNVTICAQFYFNKTFIRNNITVPEKVAEQYTRQTGLGLDELYDQFSLFLGFTTQPRPFSNQQMAYFTNIYRANPQIHDLVAFVSAALPSCTAIFKTCFFDGIEFDCCQHAVQSLDDNGVCYLLALNFDSDNASPSPMTIHQTRSGPPGGLTVEAAMSVQDYPWFASDIDNGFLVYVNPVPYSSFQSPLGAPHGAETFIRVTPAKRSLYANCAEPGKLVMKGGIMYYDPEGLSCLYRTGADLTRRYASCDCPIFLYRPNSSIVCNPLTSNIVTAFFWKEHITEEYENVLVSDHTGSTASVVQNTFASIEADLKKFLTEKRSCPKHCTYWTYQSSANFADLQHRNGNDGPKEIMYSRIHVYYSDLDYRQHKEEKDVSFYVAFCDLGNVIGLYWGMSVISVFHVIYYIPLCIYNLRNSHTGIGED